MSGQVALYGIAAFLVAGLDEAAVLVDLEGLVDLVASASAAYLPCLAVVAFCSLAEVAGAALDAVVVAVIVMEYLMDLEIVVELVSVVVVVAAAVVVEVGSAAVSVMASVVDLEILELDLAVAAEIALDVVVG